MGMLFLFFACSLVLDIFGLTVYTAEAIFKNNLHYLQPSAMGSFLISFVLSVSLSLYGYFEAKNVITEEVTIKTSKLPENIQRLKIVQISDVHIGLIVREERLKKILSEVKNAGADLLVSTGDLVDGQIDNLRGLPGLFREINPPYGKFATTGNHEFYAGLDQALDFIKKAGFRILRGEALTVKGVINIAGVDDPAGRHYGLFRDIPEKKLLSELSSKKFTLLLKHRPTVDKNSLGLFDLQLSGHTHKGQIFPFSLITKLYYPVDAGKLRLMNDIYMYVSRGTGTWGPPFRLLSPPEITIMQLVHKKGLK